MRLKQNRWALSIVPGSLGALAVALLLVPSSGAVTSGRTAVSKVERVERTVTFSKPWQARQNGDNGVVPLLLKMTVTTPAKIARVNTLAQVTLDYRSSPGDFGVVGVSVGRPGVSSATMHPGGFRVSSENRVSTTLTWVRKDLRANGARYTFYVSVAPRDGDHDGHALVTGRKVTASIEVRPTR